jgi:cobalt-zinc-cadmium efflux system outer membrane protein
LRKEIAQQSLLHYNGMFISPFQLLSAKQGEVEAQRGYFEALREYWSARAELARALGGALPAEKAKANDAAPPAPAAQPPPSKPAAPASEGNHSHEH